MAQVLVIEDDLAVQWVLLKMLEACGHEVRAAEGCVEPEKAQECNLTCCGEDVAAPNVAICAVLAHRHCSGVEAALKAVARWPSTKVLLISATPLEGWPAAERERLVQLPVRSYEFLQKPFTLAELREVLGRLMGQ